MQRYNFKAAEEKWQKIWKEKKSFKTSIKKKQKKILLFGNVSLSIRQDTHGACKKLYHR